jgi:hypothetical protein
VSEPLCFRQLASSALEKNFAAHNFDCVPSNAYVNYAVIVTRCSNKNPARPLHFDSLLNQHALVGFGHSVRYHPCRRASRRRPRSRVLSSVKQHASVQTGRGIDGFASHEVQKFPSVFLRYSAARLASTLNF